MASKPHVVIFPFMAQGHTIPMLDLSKALSFRGLKITIITTPSNSSFVISYVSQSLNNNIHLREIPFPHAHQLPKGCENTSHLLSPDQLLPFLAATKQLRPPFEQALRDMSKLPDPPCCVISDTFLGWTNGSCRAFGIPRLVFHGMGVFAMAVKKSLSIHQNHNKCLMKSSSDTEHVDVTGLMQLRFPLTTADLPDSLRQMDSCLSEFFVEAEKSDLGSWGVIVNSFIELEKDHVAPLECLYGNESTRAWCVGPLFLYDDQMEGGRNYHEEEIDSFLKLHEQEEKSVIYVAFGSQADLSDTQLDELAYGLEQSRENYIWVVRSKTWDPPIKGRGLITKNWVEQKRVLGHRAIGGFLSHCGWNSVLESLSMGVPILAWPMQNEQHLNAKFLVEEVKAALRVPTVGRERKVVRREVICEAVKELMGGRRGKKAREKAIELGKLAKRAVQVGGSSYKCLDELIHQLPLENAIHH
ncbi:UDP-glycosyltransferase 90A1-like [Corylus avellana]|uniref:UDP-glycosyltransferase 90A1-like n=1 Tax=Corylus avellana TaxID=13451 RepID=UPI001E1FD57C|nr:UDP-glycosyltransferase 90A1-like [Corylus avellana]